MIRNSNTHYFNNMINENQWIFGITLSFSSAACSCLSLMCMINTHDKTSE